MFVHDDVKSAIPFMESHSAGKPFFINLWIHEPHTPFHVDPRGKNFSPICQRLIIFMQPPIS